MTITIRQNLELDMFRMLHKVLQIHSIIAKSCHRLLLGCHKSIFQFILMISYTHAFAAAAKGRAQTRSAALQSKAAARRPRGPVGGNKAAAGKKRK